MESGRTQSYLRIQLELRVRSSEDQIHFSISTQTVTFSEQVGFFSILLNQIRFRNITERGGSVTASEWGIPWERTGLV